MTARCRWLAATCLALAPQVPATSAEPPAPANVARTDCFGDPLPDGVAARMGTVRFRHGGEVSFVGFLPDGQTILSVGKDDAVRWWEAGTGKEIRRAGRAALGSAAASPDRRVLAVRVGDDVVLWDATTGKERARVERPDDRLSGMAFSADRRLLATCGERIRLWDTETGERLREFEKGGESYAEAAFLPNARTLVSVGHDGNLRWWDAESGKVLQVVDAHAGERVVAVSPDGKRLATAGEDHALRLWDAEEKSEICTIAAPSPDQQAVCLAFSPDGKLLAAGCADGVIRLYGAADGERLRRCRGHQDAVTALAFSPNGGVLVSCGADSAVRQWDVATGREVRPFAGATGQVRTLAVSPDGATVASAGIDRRVHLWDAATGAERRSLAVSECNEVALLGFSPDGRTLTAVGCGGGDEVFVWGAADGREVQAFSLRETRYPDAFALSPDAGLVAAWARPDRIALFDVFKGTMLRESGEGDGRGSLQPGPFLAGGKALLAFHHVGGPSSMIDGLLLWDAATGGHELRPLPGDVGFFCSCTASSDGKVLAVVASDTSVHLWNVGTGGLIRKWIIGQDFILAATFSADGRTLATADLDGSVSLWETTTGRRRGLLWGGQGFIDALDFSPDGRRLYTGGHNGTVLAWDLTGLAREAVDRPTDLDEKSLDRLWDDLGGANAVRAYRAVWTLAAVPERAAPFLKARLYHAPPSAAQIERWIADLDGDDFATRERASEALRWADEAAEPALTAALDHRPLPEARRRIEELLAWLSKGRTGVHPADPRVVRAVEALEDAADPAARDALTALADGPETSLTREAKASLERLRRRFSASPSP